MSKSKLLVRPAPVRVVSAVTLILTTACQTWQPRPDSPSIVVTEEPDRVRLHLVVSTTPVVLWTPQVQSDSIFGLTEETRRHLTVREPFVVPADLVASADVRGVDVPLTVLSVVVGAGAVLLAGVALLYTRCGRRSFFC
jgi:hypothetical protein